MRKSIGIAAFIVVGAGATGAGALDNLAGMKGSDTVRDVTRDLLLVCPGADPSPGDPSTGIVYEGTGSGNGETAMQTAGSAANIPQQTIAPMSRFIAPFGNAAAPGRGCNAGNTGTPAGSFGTTASTEGLVFALDGLSVVGAKSTGASAACNGAVDSCTANGLGLANHETITGLVDTVRYPGGNYALANWRDALRVLFAGMEHGDSNNIALRDCNRELRRKLSDSYSSVFKAGCTTGGCTQIRHLFVRDNESGTTDAFAALIGVTSVNLVTNVSPWCNALRTNDPLPEPGPPGKVPRYVPDYQDFDPIRRACSPSEDVCSRVTQPIGAATRPGLGLVLTIASSDFVTDTQPITDAFPTTACTSFDLIPLTPEALPPQLNPKRCPNGDQFAFGSLCFYPKSAAGSFKCLNPSNLKPALAFDATTVEGRFATQADGRVYNLHLLKDPAVAGGLVTYEKDGRGRAMTGAYYRIHSTKSLVAPAIICQSKQATTQIGCLVASSPCSLGYAGREAASANSATTASLRLNEVSPTDACVANQGYPANRKLYVNSFLGFQNAQTLTQERELVKCFADRTKIDPIIDARGFIKLPTVNPLNGNPLAPFCEDYNDTQCTGSPANVNACLDNPTGIPGAGANESTRCGNTVVEFAEQCDDGNNVNGDGCNSACQLEN